VYDGNFSNEHMRMRQPLLDASLTDGEGHMVEEEDYQIHLKHKTSLSLLPHGHMLSLTEIFSNYRSQLVATTKRTTLWTLCHRSWMQQGLVYVHVVGMVAMCHIQWQTFRRVKGVSSLHTF